ncbi:MAG TPA: hypothetical protein ENO05_01450 [Bacteroides sp.]|nr:hypothetical protein [Bacteroides sp.]
MRIFLVIMALNLLLCSPVRAQSLIGMPKEQVTELIKKEYTDFRKDQSVMKQRFNYLKYVNGKQTKTWIAYFSDEDLCTGTKLVCDYSEYDEMLDELDSKYRRTGDREWEYLRGTDTLNVSLTREEWYFVIRERKRKSAN